MTWERVLQLAHNLKLARIRHAAAEGEWMSMVHNAKILQQAIEQLPARDLYETRCLQASLLHYCWRFAGIVVAGCCTVMSGMLMWGLVTGPLSYWLEGLNISLLGVIVEKSGGGTSGFFYSLVPLAYASFLTYVNLFKLNIPGEFMGYSCACMGFYSMQRRSSSASSLLFNAMYLCRFQFSLCWLYLMVLDWKFNAKDKLLTKTTAFQCIVYMNTTSLLGANGLNLVAAFLIIVYAVLKHFRFSRFSAHLFSEDPEVQQKIDAGGALFQRQRPTPRLSPVPADNGALCYYRCLYANQRSTANAEALTLDPRASL